MSGEILDSGSEFRQSSPDDFARIINLKAEYKEVEKKVKSARIAVWVLVVLTVIAAIYELSTIGMPELLLPIYGVLLTIYIGCGVMMNKRPRVALIVALSVYLIMQILAAIGEPMSLISGLLVKIAVIYYLAVGIEPAGRIMRIKEQLEELNVVV